MKDEITWGEYLHLRPKDLKKPEYRHVLLLLFWPIETAAFALLGRLPWTYHPVSCELDIRLPLLEGFVIPYVMWFLCIAFIVLYTLRHDIPVFRCFIRYMIVNVAIAFVFYMIYPTYFPGRPIQHLGWPAPVQTYYQAMPRQNALTWLLSFIYHVDPPTNSFPSEHVAVSMGMAVTALHAKNLRRPAFSVPFVTLQVLIWISIALTKQHSVLDAVSAFPLSVVSYLIGFRLWDRWFGKRRCSL